MPTSESLLSIIESSSRYAILKLDELGFSAPPSSRSHALIHVTTCPEKKSTLGIPNRLHNQPRTQTHIPSSHPKIPRSYNNTKASSCVGNKSTQHQSREIFLSCIVYVNGTPFREPGHGKADRRSKVYKDRFLCPDPRNGFPFKHVIFNRNVQKQVRARKPDRFPPSVEFSG